MLSFDFLCAARYVEYRISREFQNLLISPMGDLKHLNCVVSLAAFLVAVQGDMLNMCSNQKSSKKRLSLCSCTI